jgi:peroxiredoxin
VDSDGAAIEYKKYKNKNFTVLGVSLDEDKDAWVKAIQKDGLTWKHISDLKGWQSAVVPVYGIEGIPYNVLLDPEGKILATELREKDLDAFLSKTLK